MPRLTAAARNAMRAREGLAAVAEWEAEHGAFSDDELAVRRRADIVTSAAGIDADAMGALHPR
jgi:hypothetical protein